MRRSFLFVTPVLGLVGLILAFPMAILLLQYRSTAGRVLEAFETPLPSGATSVTVRYEYQVPSDHGEAWMMGSALAVDDFTPRPAMEISASEADQIVTRLRAARGRVFYRPADPHDAFMVVYRGRAGWRYQFGLVLMGLSVILWLPIRWLCLRNACA
jgi:hypothetical protein